MIQYTESYQQLLAAIEANPDDALPKLVMGDFLDDHGEPDLAYAYRWCASEGKWPTKHIGGYGRYDWWILDTFGEESQISNKIYCQLKDLGMYTSVHAHDAIADLARVLKMQTTIKVLTDVSFDGNRREEHWTEIEVPQAAIELVKS